MSNLDPRKLHVKYLKGVTPEKPILPRTYTLTHSDTTGDFFLTIAPRYNVRQISGWYTRLMRDEVLAEWKTSLTLPSLHVHCHVSGGLVLGTANWRESIFRQHMQMVLEAFRYDDRRLFATYPKLDRARIRVHFHRARHPRDRVEDWGSLEKYKI